MTRTQRLYKKLLPITLLFLMITPTMAAKPFETKRWQTSGGAQVIFYQAMEVPMLDISIAFAAGSAYDGELFGLSALTGRLLNQGNQGLNATTISESLATTGAQYEEEANQDMIVLNLRTLTSPSALKKACDIYAQIIAHPDFPEKAFLREKNQQLMAIAQKQEMPEEVANQTFFQALYKEHPYAHPIQGNKTTVEALTLSQVRHFYQQYLVSNNAVIVLVGAIDETMARQLTENLMKDLSPGQKAASISKAPQLTQSMDVEVPFPSAQTVLRLGQIGIAHNDPLYFPLMVGNYILGGGSLVSQLALELREKRGLTYGVSSQFSPMPSNGTFIIGWSTQNSQTKTSLALTKETLAAFVNKGPDEKELLAAKQYLTGSFPLSLASNRSIANMLLKIAFYRLPENFLATYIDNVNVVTNQDIKLAFQQKIQPNTLLQVIVGKA